MNFNETLIYIDDVFKKKTIATSSRVSSLYLSELQIKDTIKLLKFGHFTENDITSNITTKL